MSSLLLGAPEARTARAGAHDGPRRIGILGGTFDPPHIGHLWLATLAADAMALDRVLFMPAAQPPHKRPKGLSRAADRLLMTRLAIATDDCFDLTLIEMERPGPSYTIDSVDELTRIYGDDASLFLLMAADSLNAIDTWREPDALLQRIEWVVGPRPGSALPDRSRLEERFGANASRIHLLEGPSLDVSSSEIRARVAARHAIRYLVPRGVEELIAERGLYRRA
ncbi:MAG TPA: nicotinate-nucleotide adenylyltransferase [Candidatus Limnocylindria bacterium]|nr:nicotinate-nucleotide adenylyltransferase [Candidatus Limnocylindria bacterium]